jgi:hypothetical protein
VGDAGSALTARPAANAAAVARFANRGPAALTDVLRRQAPPNHKRPARRGIGPGAAGPLSLGRGTSTTRARWEPGMACGAVAGEATRAETALHAAELLPDDGRLLLRVPGKASSVSTTAIERRDQAAPRTVARASISAGGFDLAGGAVRIEMIRPPSLYAGMSARGGEIRYLPAVLEVSGDGVETARLDSAGDNVELTLREAAGPPGAGGPHNDGRADSGNREQTGPAHSGAADPAQPADSGGPSPAGPAPSSTPHHTDPADESAPHQAGPPPSGTAHQTSPSPVSTPNHAGPPDPSAPDHVDPADAPEPDRADPAHSSGPEQIEPPDSGAEQTDPADSGGPDDAGGVWDAAPQGGEPAPPVPGPVLPELPQITGSAARVVPAAGPGTRIRISLGDVRQASSGHAIAAKATAIHIAIAQGPDRRAYGHDAAVLDLDVGTLEVAAVAPEPAGGDLGTAGGAGGGLPITGPRIDLLALTGIALLIAGTAALIFGLRLRTRR